MKKINTLIVSVLCASGSIVTMDSLSSMARRSVSCLTRTCLDTCPSSKMLDNFLVYYNFTDIDHTDSSGMTPLMRAAQHKYDYAYLGGARCVETDAPKVMADLLNHGVDPNAALGQCVACKKSKVFVVAVITCLFAVLTGRRCNSTLSTQTWNDSTFLAVLLGSAGVAAACLIDKGECTHSERNWNALSFALRSSHRQDGKLQALFSAPMRLVIRKEDYDFTRDKPDLRHQLDEYRKWIPKNRQPNIVKTSLSTIEEIEESSQEDHD